MTGCLGAMPRPPENPAAAGGLTPVIEDTDAGLVGVAGGFELKRYSMILVDRFAVPASLVKDQEDQKLAALFPVALQSELVARLRATGLFDRVVNLGETQVTPGEQPALKLEGTITKLDPGSRALRYVVGFGAGAAKAQAETRLVDVQTGKVMVVTAHRRGHCQRRRRPAQARRHLLERPRDHPWATRPHRVHGPPRRRDSPGRRSGRRQRRAKVYARARGPLRAPGPSSRCRCIRAAPRYPALSIPLDSPCPLRHLRRTRGQCRRTPGAARGFFPRRACPNREGEPECRPMPRARKPSVPESAAGFF